MRWMPAILMLTVAAGCGSTTPPQRTQNPDALKGNETMTEAPWKSAESLAAYCDSALEEAKSLRASLKSDLSGERTRENTLERYHDLLRSLDTPMGWAGLMFQVHPDAAVRKTAGECKQRLAEFGNDVTLDRGIYDALVAVDRATLDPQAARFHKHVLREFERSGVDKDEPTRERLRKIHARMVELGQDYQENVRDDVRAIQVPVAKLKGLPKDWIDAKKPGDDGLVKVTTDYPDLIPFETYAEDGEARRELYVESLQRGWPANEPLLKELLELRHEYATILGFDSWAAYTAADKMVKTSERIDSFIQELTDIARPRAEADLKVLLARKRQDQPGAKAVEVWDRFYYVNAVRKEKYGFDSQSVRAYFPYERVKDGILSLYSELFGVEFEPLPDLPVWHDQVDAYALKLGGERIAVFYLDMHPREGKYKHAAMFGIQTGLQGGRLPIASLVCNFPDPKVGDGNALMEHAQVQTYFHEFGHLLHHLLARNSEWTSLGGIGVEWDFVEAPSQILEEWGWSPDVLGRFAKHIETDEPIPADLVARMRASEEFGKGVFVMRQLFYTAYSYYLHARSPEGLDLEAFSDEMYEKFSPYPRVENGRVYANFAHLIGYSSMYYTYQWSLVIAKDLFTRFEEAGLMDATVAREYRERILEPGGMKDAAELVEDFLGRPYNLDAYRRWLQQ